MYCSFTVFLKSLFNSHPIQICTDVYVFVCLGYKRHKMEKINYEFNPGLVLLTDWIISSGNTALSVDLLISYLEQMDRFDIVEVVQQGQGEAPLYAVFSIKTITLTLSALHVSSLYIISLFASVAATSLFSLHYFVLCSRRCNISVSADILFNIEYIWI